MPNELKNALKASTNHTMSRQLPVAGTSTVSVMVWTISGIVLASCGGGGGAGGSGLSVAGDGRPTVPPPSTDSGDGGGDGASGPSGNIARVVDGPVKGAAVYFDIDGDGEVSDSERAAQKQNGDPNGDPMYITDANGYVEAPTKYEGHFFIANVEGAIDTATGDTLSGEYQSLSTGGIATPITDLITDQIGASGSDADAQGVLDDIFGTDGLVTVDDIRDAEKYKIQEYDVPKPTLPSDPTNAEEQAQYDRYLAEYKTSIIMKSSLALSEIDKDEAFTNLESSTARVDALKQIFDDDPNNGDSALMERIDTRVDAGREILGRSKPLAQPDSSISPINEDSVFRFPQNSEAIFGFDDPGGNSDDADTSRFTGIYVKSSVDFSQANQDHTVNLLYDASPLSRHEVAGSDSLPGNLPPEAGFYYVSYENLSRLSISPSRDDSGTLEVEYYVFDGEQWSDKASLEITVSPVDDPATAVALGTQSLGDINENTVTAGMKVADLTVTDADGAPHRLAVGGAHAGFFEIRNADELWLMLQEGQLDYETTPTLTVHVEVAGANPAVRTGNITVAVNNVNDNLPMIEPLGSQIPLDEGRFDINTLTGYRYTASDADGGAPTLSVSGDPQNRFAIDASGKLQIKAGAEFDYETPADRAITLTITATDSGVGSGNPPAAATQEVTITFGGANDAPTATPKLGISTNDNAPYTFSAVDFGFRDVDADDLDDQFHSVIITSLPGQGQGTLALNGVSVRVGDAITFTDINNGRLIYIPNEVQPGQTTYNAAIGYRVVDDGDGDGANGLRSDTATLVIAVGQNQSATAVALGTQSLGDINENTVTAGMKVADLTVTDADGTPHRLAVGGAHAGFFEIRNEDELWLVLQEGQLDYETTPTLTVQVEVSGAPAINTGVITVTVNNVNDNLPVITHSGRQIPLLEGTFSVDTNTRYRYTASDADGGTPALSVSGDPRERFQIDTNGNLQIKANSEFDYENPDDSSITLTITAADSGVGSGNQPINTTETVTIRLRNINDNPPVITQSGRQVPLDEGTFSSDTNTGYSYTVSDADGVTSTLRVSGDPQNRFAIDASGNLQIKAGSEFNYESLDEGAITLTITATDSGVGPGSPAVTDTETVIITFGDVNEPPPEQPPIGDNIDSGDADFDIAIDGYLATGAVLTATEATPDPDIDNAVYSYQWYHIGADMDGANVDIVGATDRSYTIADTDVGKRIGVRVSYAEDSFLSDGITPTGTESITAELIPRVFQTRYIEVEFTRMDEGYRLESRSASITETFDHLILTRYRNAVIDSSDPFTILRDGNVVAKIFGADRVHFMLVQSTNGVYLAARTGFNYDNPVDADRDNNYEFNVRDYQGNGRDIRVTKYYTLTIIDAPSNFVDVAFIHTTVAGINTAHASITETVHRLKFTSLEDAVRAYSGIDDVLLDRSATFGGAIVDATNHQRALVIFKVAGQADIVFTYKLSGDDLNDVRLVQDGYDVSLVTVADHLDYDNPADQDGMNTYSVVETITTTSPNVPSVHRDISTTYTLSVTDNPSDYNVDIYESQPLYRPIEIDSVDLQGYQLTEGYVDNALFTINEDGHIWWKAVSDYEVPHDGDRDNIYEIELSRTNNDQTDRIQVDIRVKNTGISPAPGEDYSPHFPLAQTDIADEHLPSEFAQHLILGAAWKVPATGPVIVQYSLDTDELASFYNNNQMHINKFYSLLDLALLSFEQAANLKFIEVARGENDDDAPYLKLHFSPGLFSYAILESKGGANIVYSLGHIGPDRIYTDTIDVQSTIIHELGHALGLHHPFEETNSPFPGLSWPGNEDYRNSPLSIISYNDDVSTLQPADIEALQFLYGAPGTNFMGVESIMAASRFANELAIETQTLTEIDANTDLTAGIKVADITLADQDRGAFGTLEVDGDHADFFEIRSGNREDWYRWNVELWLVLEEGETLEDIATLEVYLRIAEKPSTRTDDITITVNDAGNLGPAGSSGLVGGAVGNADQIKIDETVDEGQSVIANLIDLDLGEIDLTEIIIGGDDRDYVQIRQTQNGGILEFVSAPDFEAPEDDNEDNVYEIILHDDLMSIEVDITVIDIPEL